jgi:hypothetical protein
MLQGQCVARAPSKFAREARTIKRYFCLKADLADGK